MPQRGLSAGGRELLLDASLAGAEGLAGHGPAAGMRRLPLSTLVRVAAAWPCLAVQWQLRQSLAQGLVASKHCVLTPSSSGRGTSRPRHCCRGGDGRQQQKPSPANA